MANEYSSSDHRLDRKSLKRPDGFFSAVRSGFQGLFEHNRILLSIVGALIMIGSATAFFLNRMEHQTQKARTAFYEGKKSQEAEAKKLSEQQKTLSNQPVD